MCKTHNTFKVTIYPDNKLYEFTTFNEAVTCAKLLSMQYGNVATVCHHKVKRGKIKSINSFYSWGRKY